MIIVVSSATSVGLIIRLAGLKP